MSIHARKTAAPRCALNDCRVFVQTPTCVSRKPSNRSCGAALSFSSVLDVPFSDLLPPTPESSPALLRTPRWRLDAVQGRACSCRCSSRCRLCLVQTSMLSFTMRNFLSYESSSRLLTRRCCCCAPALHLVLQRLVLQLPSQLWLEDDLAVLLFGNDQCVVFVAAPAVIHRCHGHRAP